MAIHKSLSKLISDKEFNHVVIGYSGGVDSSVLLYLIIKNSIINIKENKIKNLQNIYHHNDILINFSLKFQNILDEIRKFLRIKMYNNDSVLTKNNNGKKIIKKLFTILSKKPKKYLSKEQLKFDKDRAIADYISGMTDRYAINLYNKIK